MPKTTPFFQPPLDPYFVPAALWNRAYGQIVAKDPAARTLDIALERPDGGCSRHSSRILSAGHPDAARSLRYAERLLKFLLWQKGGCSVSVAGAPEITRYLAEVYSPAGARAFDFAFMGERVYRTKFSIREAKAQDLPPEGDAGLPVGRHLDGCRIGFDIGGSDRKAAAVIDGKVVFSEETRWDPYFQKDPSYHIEGIHDSLMKAAAASGSPLGTNTSALGFENFIGVLLGIVSGSARARNSAHHRKARRGHRLAVPLVLLVGHPQLDP